MRIALPLADGKLTVHFAHCQEFAIIEVEDDEITNIKTLVPPPHEPGVLPVWLHSLGTSVIIAGGMGSRALNIFEQNGIKVVTGASSEYPEILVKSYLGGTLTTGDNICDH
jgi:predicted Fe-Mo cluster-binding NifX family protein